MSTNIMQEIYFLMHAIVMGILITFVYDWIRIIRRVVNHNLFFISIEDLFFWIGCSIGVFLMFYRENNGTLRWFAIIGAAIGMSLYKITLSYFFVTYMSLVLKKVINIITKLILIILKPLALLLKKEAILTKKAYGKTRGVIRFLKKRLTVFIKMVKIMLCKQ